MLTVTAAQACSPLSNAAVVVGAVVLMQRGTCQFVQKALAAQQAGAVGVLVGNLEGDNDGGYLAMSAPVTGSPVAIPSASLPGVLFRQLQGLLTAAPELSVAVDGVFDMAAQPLPDSMDPSSSFGPTSDRRIKPDLVAPGTVRSVEGGSGCGYTVKVGTSMSAPAAAGAAPAQYSPCGL